MELNSTIRYGTTLIRTALRALNAVAISADWDIYQQTLEIAWRFDEPVEVPNENKPEPDEIAQQRAMKWKEHRMVVRWNYVALELLEQYALDSSHAVIIIFSRRTQEEIDALAAELGRIMRPVPIEKDNDQ